MARASDAAYYNELFRTVTYKENVVALAGTPLLRARQRYEAVQVETGVPWYVIALIHAMEASGSFLRQILNGQPINQKTTIKPKGFGPWRDWHESAVFALTHYHFGDHVTWTVADVLYRLEWWNGWGYRGRGLNSDYLWGGSNHDDPGKYIEDGHYEETAETKQVGAGVLLRWLVNHGCVDEPPRLGLIRFDERGTNRSEIVRWYQAAWNALRETHDELRGAKALTVDGWAGRKTSDVHFRLFGRFLDDDPRQQERSNP